MAGSNFVNYFWDTIIGSGLKMARGVFGKSPNPWMEEKR
jgi:hypothetical protein